MDHNQIDRDREAQHAKRIADARAVKELVEACEREFIGDVCQDAHDDEPVATGMDGDGNKVSSPITFGMIRRARAALPNIGVF